MKVGDVLIVTVGVVAGESTLLADIQLATTLLVAEHQLDSVQLTLVRLERTALCERLITSTTPVRTHPCMEQTPDKSITILTLIIKCVTLRQNCGGQWIV